MTANSNTAASEIKVPRDLPLGHMRAFLTLLVVAHHAALAYHPYAPSPNSSLVAEPRLWLAFPIVDAARMKGIDLFVGFNDVFFMSLLFLISGVFAWGSLVRRGAGGFMRERGLRLGIPFVISVALLAPLAYYPTWLQMGDSGGPFLTQWLALGEIPAGPAWFLWALLAAAAVVTLLNRLLPNAFQSAGQAARMLGEKPIRFAFAVIAISAVAYLPMAMWVGPMQWSDAGPFYIQTSRAFHYLAYFLIGVALGAGGLQTGLFEARGRLARRWPLWILAALLSFATGILVLLQTLQAYATGGPGLGLQLTGHLSFVLCCATASLACIAIFVRFARRANPIADHLSQNAYGIYIFHYVAVSWLQWSVLDFDVGALTKIASVFLGAVVLSWGFTAAIRKIPAVSRII